MYPQKIFNLGLYSCLETKKNVVQIDLRTSKSSEKYVCTSKHISVSWLCMHVHGPKWEKVKTFLEEKNKVNSISYTLKIEIIANFYHLGLRKSFLALKIMRKAILFSFPG